MLDILKQYEFATDHILVVIRAREHGRVFELKDGSLTELSYVSEHPPTHSDNEGFFQRSGNGVTMGSGNVREEDDEHNLKRFITSFAETISAQIDTTTPRAVLLTEPEHLKGMLVEYITAAHEAPFITAQYGNYVEQSDTAIRGMVESWYEATTDPTDPESVAGEENAEEKRKILEVAQHVQGESK